MQYDIQNIQKDGHKYIYMYIYIFIYIYVMNNLESEWLYNIHSVATGGHDPLA